jgi:hypothetical protein
MRPGKAHQVQRGHLRVKQDCAQADEAGVINMSVGWEGYVFIEPQRAGGVKSTSDQALFLVSHYISSVWTVNTLGYLATFLTQNRIPQVCFVCDGLRTTLGQDSRTNSNAGRLTSEAYASYYIYMCVQYRAWTRKAQDMK